MQAKWTKLDLRFIIIKSIVEANNFKPSHINHYKAVTHHDHGAIHNFLPLKQSLRDV